jgi:hypothetical protein
MKGHHCMTIFNQITMNSLQKRTISEGFKTPSLKSPSPDLHPAFLWRFVNDREIHIAFDQWHKTFEPNPVFEAPWASRSCLSCAANFQAMFSRFLFALRRLCQS